MSKAVNLHQELRRGSFDFALLTTYEFDTTFFESFALETFDALAGCSHIVVFTDASTHTSMLHATGARRPRQAGLRYVPTPVACGGVFHPKVFLLASKNLGLLVVGSANLTRAGFSRNAELVNVLRFERTKAEKHLALFQDAFAFLSELARTWPTPTVTQVLEDVAEQCDWLAPVDAGPRRGARIMHNLTRPLWPQLLDAAGPDLQTLSVVSPYFEAEPTILDRIAPQIGSAKLEIFTEGRRTTMTPRWLDHRLVQNRSAEIWVGSYADDGKPQRLHGKAVAMTSNSATLLAFGSANFTSPALLRAADEGNVEVMVVLPGLPKEFDVTALFDPLQSAKPADPDDLCEHPDYDEPRSEVFDFRLVEARIDEESLIVQVEMPAGGAVRWIASVSLEGMEPVVVGLRLTGDGILVGTPGAELLAACSTQVATVQVLAYRDDGTSTTSGLAFLMNLQHAPTGARRRLERRVREAQQNAARFADVLAELLACEDDAPLIRFLLMCNIRLGDESRPSTGRSTRDAWQPGAMRTLGERNVGRFLSVHDAALDFIDRHIRRIRRRARSLNLSGVPAVMHVARSVAEVARAQLERLVIGIEEASKVMSAEVWGKCRENAGQYLARVQELLDCVTGYAQGLSRRVDPGKVRAELAPDLAPFHAIADDLLGIRERLDACTLRVRTPSAIVSAPYFARDLLHEDRFQLWASNVRTQLQSLSS